ncbi:MAG: DUF4402 domain-containing protein [Bacteroidales bacterium]
MKKILMLTLVFCGFAAAAFGQVSRTATATATIVAPIAITKEVDMNFGNVAVSASAGTVVLTPANSRSVTGGCTLPATLGTVTAASFTVTGTSGYSYSIALPSTPTTISSGGNTMTVSNFTSSPTPTGTLAGGTSTLTVGATLNVAGGQAPGEYVSGTPFTVTVNYN